MGTRCLPVVTQGTATTCQIRVPAFGITILSQQLHVAI